MSIWSGIGIGYGYTGQPATGYADDLAYIYSLGFRSIRINYPRYTDTPTKTFFRQIVQQAITQGFTTIHYGLTFGAGSNWGTSDESVYLTQIQNEATWAQSLGSSSLWFSVGNESTNSRNSSQVTAAQVRTFVRSCATAVQSIYTVGPVTYTESADYSSPYLAPLWISEGLGDLDYIGWNVYGITTNFTFLLSNIVPGFTSSNGFISEFNLQINGVNGFVNTTDDAQATNYMGNIYHQVVNSGLGSGLLYKYVDDADIYGIKLFSNGGLRGSLASVLATRPWYTPLSTLLSRTNTPNRGTTPSRGATPNRSQYS